MLKVIGGAESGEFKAVASGTLPNGKPVVVNADGTVSAAAETTQAIGTKTNTSGESAVAPYATFDSNSNKVVIIYYDALNSDYLTTVIGTVSGTSISFGTPVVVSDTMGFTADGRVIAATFDSNSNKVVLAYDPQNSGGSTNAVVRVGTVSGTSISYGATTDLGGNYGYMGICFDSNNNKVVVAYIDANGRGRAVVGTVSGTTISIGTDAEFNGNTGTANISCVYDVANDKVVIAYRDGSTFGGDGPGRAVVATVSGTSISFGSEVTFSNNNVHYVSTSYDIENSKVVIAYVDLDIVGNTVWGKAVAVVGTVSGSTISFGTRNYIHDSINVQYTFVTYDPVAKKHLITSMRKDSPFQGKYVEGTVSGTDITVTSVADFNANGVAYPVSTYDSANDVCVIAYRDRADNTLGAQVYRFQTTNLTAENYIGLSRGVVSSSGSAGRTGSETVFEAATSRYVYSAYDSNSDKVVIAYADNGNLQYGTAIVGTVSGTTISFGSPVVFESAEVQNVGVTFDSNSNKVVITYADEGNSSYPTAIVGTVSGTSISFGTPVVVDSANADSIVSTFDSTNNKVVVGFKNPLGNQYPKAIVGTVSGTSISFGASATIESVVIGSNRLKLAYDSNSGKVVSVYDDTTNSLGRSAIGTVSGTSISFGTPVTFVSNLAASLGVPVIDSDTNKVIITYKDNGNSNYGTAKVGTISGTSISFGAASVFNQGNTELYSGQAYNPTLQKAIVAFRDDGDSNIGKYVYGTVSGTDITFSTEVSFNSGRADNLTMVYDPVSTNMVLSFEDNANSSHGTSLVFSPDTLVVTRGEVTDGNVASVDIIGSVSDNQLSLTAGSKYYVQTDGTLSTTADDPSVLAGTAIASNKLIVKT